jgi:predicted ArsR family transcriptional regulator
MAILLAPQLEALLRAIEEFDGDSATRCDLAAIADEVAEELRQPVPDKSRILKRLSKIESIAGPAGAVDGATTALAALAEALL